MNIMKAVVIIDLMQVRFVLKEMGLLVHINICVMSFLILMRKNMNISF